ncbi:MAG: hypothetical protein IJU90_00175 [Bacteroidales bacterium]|nr:hypothetical protein [Bacteroidales bacterium]
MSKRLLIICSSAIVAAMLLFACSTQKARWANIAYHNTTTHYNVWWNGNESLKEGIELLEKNAKDDYTQVLPIYKLGTKEEAMSVYPQMDRAIEKGVKGIKKHSMFIKGKEYVSYIPECYLLTAYAAFYKHEYVTVANTCRVMRVQYAGTRAADEASILLGRSLTATQQYVEAESVLDQLVADLGKGNFNKKLTEKLYLAVAEATLPQDKYKKTVQFIKMALDENPSRATKARLNFILGQIYQKIEKRNVAVRYYDEALKNGPEYVMEFNARINMATCADVKSSNIDKLERDLDKMLRDKKNEEYHDQIYYAKGEMFMGAHNEKKAVENFCRSVAVSTSNPAQKAKSALRAADIYYDIFENYETAQLYYDTAMGILQPTYSGYADIKVRYDMLSELTTNTRLVMRNDSLLRVADMSPKEREAFIQNIIDEKKRKEEEAKQRELLAQFSADAKAQQNTLTGDWYFYNSNTVQKGKESFAQRWGARVLEDYWFLSKKKNMGGNLLAGMEADIDDTAEGTDDENDSIASVASKSSGDANDPNSIAFYEKDLPSSQTERDSMRHATAEALLNAGYLFYDGIHNTERALECYLRLANQYPDYEQIVQAFFMLYRIYDRQGNTPNANYYRDMVLMGFPDSDFANLIRDENYYKEIAKREQLLQNEYDDLFTTYRRRRYKEVINQAQVVCSEYPDDHMLPKFRYWEAMSYVRINEKDNAIRVFKNILSSVPATDSIVPLVNQQLALLQKDMPAAELPSEAAVTKADEEITPADEAVIAKKDPIGAATPANEEEKPLSSEAQMFRYRENMQHYVAIVVNDRKIRATDIQYKIADFNSQYYSNSGYRVNPLMFTDTTQLITVHRFDNAQVAMDYVTHLLLDSGPLKQFDKADYVIFPISTQNYTTFYSRKQIDAYIEFYERYYKKGAQKEE